MVFVHGKTLCFLAVLITLASFLSAFSPAASACAATTAAFSEESKVTTLIIDAGHGGEDGGAQSAEGLPEACINLSIAQRMEALAQLWGIPTIMTRNSPDIDYPDSALTTAERKSWDQTCRGELIRSVDKGILVSIHQNFYPSPEPRGAQVLYSASDESQTLGVLMHGNLVCQLDPDNRRVAAPVSDTIYITRTARCPAVLVECGFLSNPDEASRLLTEDYQMKLATVIFGSCLQYLGGTNESKDSVLLYGMW